MPDRRILLFSAGLIALLLATLITTRIQTDISAFAVAGDNAEEILLASEMQSGALSRRIILSISSADKSAVPHAFMRGLMDDLSAIDGVTEVWFPEESRVAMNSIQSLYASYGSNLYSLDPGPDLAELLSASRLQQRAVLLKQALLSPQGGEIKKIAQIDPLLLLLKAFQSLSTQAPVLTDADPAYRNLILETRASGLDLDAQRRIQDRIHQVFNARAAGFYLLEMTGVPLYALVTQSLIQQDIARVSILSSVLITGLFLALFRSFLSLFRVALVMLASISASVLITNLVFGSVHGLTLAIGTTLIGICIDYPIHALAHAHAVAENRRSALIARIWPSMLLGGATTLIGYAALGFSGYPGFQQIAVYAGSGIVLALLLTRFVLPWTLHRAPGAMIEVPGVARWAGFCDRYRRIGITGLCLLLLFSMLQSKHLNWVDDLQKLIPELDALKQRDRAIRSRMVSIEPGRFVLLSAKNTESALQKAEEIYPVLERLKQTGELDAYFGLYPWLLSEKKQRENQRELNARLSPEVRENWKKALQKQGLSVEKLGALNYAGSDILSPERVLESPVRRLIDSQIVENPDRSLILIWIGRHSPEKLSAALEAIEDAYYFSQRDLLNKLAQSYTERAKWLLAIGLLAIFLLLWIRYRKLRAAVNTLLPSLISAYLIFSIWAFLGTAVSFLHLVGFILAIAICVDYGIFYQENRAQNAKTTYQAMAASMLTSALAFGCLAAAETESLKILAGVVSLGVISGFLLCPLLIRPAERGQRHA